MKIITLNTWGGRAGREGLLEFFKNHKDHIDVFCLQEMWSAPYEKYDGHPAGGLTINQNDVMTSGVQDISGILSNYTAYFRPHFLENYGLLMFVRNDLKVVGEGEVFVYKDKGYIPDGDIGNHARNIQYTKIDVEGELYTIINFHGLWNGKGKTDSEDRIKQSEKIIDFVGKLVGEVILCGDFNLLPETESIKIIESAGLRDLVVENNIQSTRTSFYLKPDKFADYIFTSKNVEILDFKVLPDEVSDHSPLYLEFK